MGFDYNKVCMCRIAEELQEFFFTIFVFIFGDRGHKVVDFFQQNPGLSEKIGHRNSFGVHGYFAGKIDNFVPGSPKI